MKYLLADLLPKVFHGLVWILCMYYTGNNLLGVQYQGQLEKVTVPMVFSHILP